MVQKVSKIWMDGKLIPWEEANVHILTHSLHYGLGVFEGIRCYLCHDGKSAVFRLREYVDRLFDSAQIGDIKIPYSAELTPVREVDDRISGHGKPGPVTKELQTAFFDIVKGKNPEYQEWLDYL